MTIKTVRDVNRKIQDRRAGRWGIDGAKGLYLHLSRNSLNCPIWAYRYRHAGVERYMSLGPAINKGLDDVRLEACQLREVVRNGRDPMVERKFQREGVSLTFSAVAAEFLALETNDKCRKLVTPAFATHCADIAGMSITAITTDDIRVRVLDPIWREIPKTARNVVQRHLERLFAYVINVKKLRSDNPATWEGCLDHCYKAPTEIQETEHRKELPGGYKAVPAFMRWLEAHDDVVTAAALRFLVLTAVRSHNVTPGSLRHERPQWEHIDLDRREWTIAKFKTSKAHGGKPFVVPLSDAAMAVLGELRARPEFDPANPFVFPSVHRGKGLSEGRTADLLAEYARDTAHIHGFRASFKGFADANRKRFSEVIAEAALMHRIVLAQGETKVAASYRRDTWLDERRELMQAWGEFCDRGHIALWHENRAA